MDPYFYIIQPWHIYIQSFILELSAASYKTEFFSAVKVSHSSQRYVSLSIHHTSDEAPDLGFINLGTLHNNIYTISSVHLGHDMRRSPKELTQEAVYIGIQGAKYECVQEPNHSPMQPDQSIEKLAQNRLS